MKILKDQILASTNRDLHGDKLSEEDLRIIASQIPEPLVMLNQHNPMAPPISYGRNRRIVRGENGVLLLMMDVEVVDEEAYSKMGGYSISYLKRVYSLNRDKHPQAQVLFNPRIFDEEDAESFVRASKDDILVNAVERIEKALVVDAILHVIIAVPVASFCAGFFNKMGADSWDRLKQAIVRAQSKHKADDNIDVITHFKFIHSFDSEDVEVLVQVRVDEYQDIEESPVVLDELLQHIDDSLKENRAKRIAVKYDEATGKWRTSYILLPDNTIKTS